MPGPTGEAFKELAPVRVFISLQRYRTREEGRISHLKRRYGMGCSRLKGPRRPVEWTEWGILAYNHDTVAVRAG